MTASMSTLLMLAAVFVGGFLVGMSPTILARLKSAIRGSPTPELTATAVSWRRPSDEYRQLVELFREQLQQAHAERTGTFVPSDVQKADIRRLAEEALKKRLAEMAGTSSPGTGDG